VNPDGTYTYTPTTGYSGTDSFTYSVTDRSGATSTATVTLTVVPINPIAKPDVYSFNEDTVLTGQNVLSSTVAVAGESNSLSVTTQPTHGTLVLAPDFATTGQFTYTPNTHYTGTDTFTYTITDGSGHSSTATVTLDVLPVAEAPTLSLTAHTYSIGTTFEETSLAGKGFADLPVSGLAHGTETGGSTPDLTWHTDNVGNTIEIGIASTYAVTGDATQVMELEQNPNDASNFYTNVNTRQGEVYTLSFDYAARGNADAGITKVVYVYWEGQLVDVLNSQSTAMTHYTINVAATQTGSGRLEFVSGDSDSYGGVFDNIQFTLNQNTGLQGYSVPIPVISAGLTNSDPGEALHVAIGAIPVGDTITDGANTFTATAGATSHDITGWTLSNLSLVSPTSGQVTLDVTATATDPNGTTASTSHNVTLNVLPISTGLSDTSGTTTSNETTPNEVLWALSNHATLTAGSGNDTLIGGTGNETLTGGAGNDLISAGSGNDVLIAGSGNDTLSAGPGNDTMTGGTGVDVFKWHLGDQGTTAAPAVDTINDFNPAAASSGGDILDLRDLLVGEARPAGTTGAGDLTNYLQFSSDTHGDTVIHVSSAGNFAAGGSGQWDQTIILTGVNLVGNETNAQVITTLLNEGKLVTNGH
jgi:Ca2+-binding RTX toxin-like protein